MTTNRHFCEVFYTDVRVPAANLVGVEGAAFKQTMRQLEHERGGIDRLVSNRALYLTALARADRDDPIVRQEIARLETGYRLAGGHRAGRHREPVMRWTVRPSWPAGARRARRGTPPWSATAGPSR